jgi:aspartate aminotransferase
MIVSTHYYSPRSPEMVAPHVKELMSSSSFIRKMFEEGIKMKAEFGADKVFDFSIGNPDLEPPPKVKKMLAELGQSGVSGLHGYMPNPGYPETRAAMAAKVSREQGVTLDFKGVVMGVGAAGAMNSVLKAILSPGDEVLVPAPYFAEYGNYVRNHGGVLKPVATKGDFSLDTGSIASAITEKTAAIIINSPNNPTGKIYTSADIDSLASVLGSAKRRTGRTVLVIADEPYREIVYDNRAIAPIFPKWDATVVVSSFAKNLSLPGERIGYAAVNPSCPEAGELVDAIIFATRVLGFVNAPATFQRIVASCWDEPVDYSSYAKRRDALTAILDRAGIEYAVPEGAFYLFCKVPARKAGGATGSTTGVDATAGDAGATGDDGAFCAHLKNYKILGVPGTGFGKRGWFRLAYCVSAASIANSADAFARARADW